jgi:DNA-binding CsgD family transcriptional regulator
MLDPANVRNSDGTAGTAASVSCLSARESQVLEMASRGLTNLEIAAQLGVTVHAVKFHLGSVFRKLGVHNRTEAVVRYVVSTPQERSTHGHASGSE